MHGTFTAPNLDTSEFLAKHGIYINPSLSKISELQKKRSSLLPEPPSKQKKTKGVFILAGPPDYELGDMVLNVGDLYPRSIQRKTIGRQNGYLQ